MTDQTNADMIAEAKSRAELCDADTREAMRDTGNIIVRLAERLEAAERRADAAREEVGYEKRMREFISGERDRFIDLKRAVEQDRNQLAAVVEKVRGEATRRELDPDLGDWADELLALIDTTPADALREHDARVRAEEREKADPAKDERLARYMALVTPLGYASALEVVNSMTALMNVEARAGEIAEQAREDEREKAAQIAENSSEFEVYMDEDGHRSIRIREREKADREPSEAEVEAFREEWKRADAEGDAGNRVRRGLIAARIREQGKEQGS